MSSERGTTSVIARLTGIMASVLRWLVPSYEHIQDEETRQTAILFSKMLLAVAAAASLVIVIAVYFDPQDLYDTRTYAGFSIIVAAAVFYAINRTGHTRWSTIGFVAYTSLVCIITPYAGNYAEFTAFTLVPMLLAGMFFGYRAAAILIGGLVITVYILNNFTTEDIWTRRIQWYFLFIAGALVLTFKYHLTHLEAIRRKKLDDANARLRHSETVLEQRVLQRTEELAAANAELASANEQLHVLSRLKDEFVANVSHELKTPIASLKINEDLLQRNPQKMETYRSRLSRETDRLDRLIEDLLRLSRLDQQSVPFAPQPCNLNELTRIFTQDRVSMAEQKQISLTYQPTPDLPEINIDGGLIEQVLSILITNALNFTPPNGKIVVRTGQQSLDDQEWVGFSVHDSGPGIPVDERDQLFTRFFRGSVGRQSGTPGTGLGLAIAWEIIQLHHGRIEVVDNDASDEGAAFNVWLPAVSHIS